MNGEISGYMCVSFSLKGASNDRVYNGKLPIIDSVLTVPESVGGKRSYLTE